MKLAFTCRVRPLRFTGPCAGREQDDKTGPAKGRALDPHLTTMGLYEVLHHGEANPAPTRLSARTSPEEPLENLVKLFRLDPRAGVRHL